jgi:CHASE1-domain containing sensor protein
VIGVGVALTLLAVWASIDDAHQRALSAFDREVGSRVLDAEKRISGSLEAIDEVGGLFAASTSSVTREEFLTFASSTLARHSDLRSLAWAPLVTDVERGAFEAEARASGIVGYSIMEYAQGAEAHPAGKRDSYLPLLYAVNVAGEAPDYGLDITTWSRLRGMIDQARDAGSPRVTATFETPSGLKVTVFHPHYRKGAPTGTVDERRAAFSGIVFGIMDPSLVLGHEEPGPLDSQLEDGIMTSAAEVTAIGAGSILFRDSEFDEANERFSVSYTLPVGNQKWVLTFVSTDVLDAWVDTNQPWVLLVLGLAIAG